MEQPAALGDWDEEKRPDLMTAAVGEEECNRENSSLYMYKYTGAVISTTLA
jgi:hypothetical protein